MPSKFASIEPKLSWMSVVVRHRFEIGAPHCHGSSPGSRVAHREHDRVAGRLERVAHARVQRLLDLLLGLAREVAVGDVAAVVLHVVDAPRRERRRVLGLVPVAAGEAGARGRAGVLVDAELEPQAVDVVGDRLDPVREARGVGDQVPGGVAAPGHPAVVDVDVVVPGRLHPVGDHLLGGLLDQLRVHAAVHRVPVVPAHRRRQREPVVLRGGAGGGPGERGRARHGRDQQHAEAASAAPRHPHTMPVSAPHERSAPHARENVAWAAEQARAQGASITIEAVNSQRMDPTCSTRRLRRSASSTRSAQTRLTPRLRVEAARRQPAREQLAQVGDHGLAGAVEAELGVRGQVAGEDRVRRRQDRVVARPGARARTRRGPRRRSASPDSAAASAA